MTKPATLALSLIVLCAAAGLAGCDWLWSSAQTASKTASAAAAKPAAPAPQAASPGPAAAAIAAAPEPVAAPPARMTLAEEADFDAWMIKTYLACWKPPASPADADPYVAQVRLAFKPNGSLSKPPKLVNPPSNPALKPQAKSVMAAVAACNPLPVPAQYRPFYEQWRTKTVHFNPQVAAR
jgi:colicin import membrane protein